MCRVPALIALADLRDGFVQGQLQTAPDQILVTNGSQEGVLLAAQTLADPGDVVLVEQPTYLTAIQSFTMTGARLVPVATDSSGVLPDALEAAIREHHPALVHPIPTFQNPTGRPMPLGRRREVARVLVSTDTPLLEDDPYGGLRYEGGPRSLHRLPGGHDRADAPPQLGLGDDGPGTAHRVDPRGRRPPGLRPGWTRSLPQSR